MRPANIEFLPAVTLAYVVAIFAAASVCAFAIVRWSAAAQRLLTPQGTRSGCLDGMRGFLALGVMVHHSYVAYGSFTIGRWELSGNPILNQLGQTTVAMFFMITGYLFSNKLLGSTERSAQWWLNLYKSRLARLAPLYLLVVLAVVVSVAYLTGFALREPAGQVATEILEWVVFVMHDRPDINGLPVTWTLIAGVNWSLKYEWAFYASLLVIVWPLRILSRTWPARVAILIFCLLLLQAVLSPRGLLSTALGIKAVLHLTQFACGIGAALIVRDDALQTVLRSLSFRILALACLISIGFFLSSNKAPVVAMTFIVFLAVGTGASFFGLFRLRFAVWLGEVSYGIYLIHGLVLFWVLHALAAPFLITVSLYLYCAIISLLAMVVVGLASASYIFIERPAMARFAPSKRLQINRQDVSPGSSTFVRE